MARDSEMMIHGVAVTATVVQIKYIQGSVRTLYPLCTPYICVPVAVLPLFLHLIQQRRVFSVYNVRVTGELLIR